MSSISSQRLQTFNNILLVIAEGYITWHGEIEECQPPLFLTTPMAYGAASIYYFYNTLGPRNNFFTYLCEDQNSVLKDFQKNHLITASGKPLFSNKQLEDLTMLLPDNAVKAATVFTPRQLNRE
jgi:hypothetical protein